MELHFKFITGKSQVWSLGVGFDPQGMINFDFVRWYFLITWHRD